MALKKGKKLHITEINIYPLINQPQGIIAFCSVQLDSFLRLNSLGVRLLGGGEIKISLPAKKIENNYKLYFELPQPERKEIEKAIKEKIAELGLFKENFKVPEENEAKD